MSSFFDESSLCLIPSGYKNGKIYSVKPTDGSGDLTFTRASNATRVGPDGLIEKVRTNLQIYSQDFRNVAEGGATNTWTPNDTVILSTNNEAPDGTLTATRIRGASGGNKARQAVIIGTSGAPYSGSIFIRRVSGTENITLRVGDVATAIGINPSSTWQRFSHTASSSTTTVRLGLVFTNDTDEFEIWGAQLETGDIATDYIATTSAAVSVGPVSGLPRLDYLGSSCPRLLLEPQRQNLALFSESFDNAVWAKSRGTITANAIASPDGYTNADLWSQNSGETTAASILQNIIVTSGTAYSLSVFAKKQNKNFLGIRANSVSATPSYFDLENGTLGTVNPLHTAKIEDYGNGWYRCSISYTTNSTSAGNNFYPTDGSSLTVTDSGGIYLWGAQLEAASYPTSYIPTLGAAVTRGADVALKTGISSLIGQTEGTLFVDFNLLQLDGFGGIVELNTTAIGVASRFLIWETTSNQLQANFGTMASVINKNGITVGRHKAAITYGPSFFKFFVDGVKIGQVVPSTAPSGLSLFSFETAAGSVNFQKKEILQSLLFKTELTDAQAIELTTI